MNANNPFGILDHLSNECHPEREDSKQLKKFFDALSSEWKPPLKTDEAKALLQAFANDLDSLITAYEEKINQL
jgi:hypothetical protein